MRMYCPYCKKEVFTKREDLNIPLIILLSIFTGGIGTLIYLLIWYNFEENRCVHCKGVCTRPHPIPQENSTIETCNGGCPQQLAGGHASHQDKDDEGDVNIQLNYCPNCGMEFTD